MILGLRTLLGVGSSSVVGCWGSPLADAFSITTRTVARFPSKTLATATLAASTFLVTACGSSSSQTATVTGPTDTKCGLQVRADNASFTAEGGTGRLGITTNRECSWTVKSDAAWVTVAPSEGQGDGSIQFKVAANADPSPRSTAIGVNDQRLQISQAARACEFSLSSNRESVEGAGGDRTIQIRANAAACGWTATAGVPWITIVSGREGRGDGEVRFHVEAVNGPPRTGSLSIAGQTVNVDQGTGCSYAIGSDSVSVDPVGGERQVPVTAPLGCGWTAESQTSWITITSGASGSGPGQVSFRVAATDGPTRTGTLMAAGRRVTVTQGAGCSVAVTPTAITADARGGPASISVQTAAGCTWSAASSAEWIGIAGGASGTGPAQVQVAVAANAGPGRTGAVTIAGQSVSITQATGCSVSVTPAAINADARGGPASVSVQTAAGCTWSAASGADWVTIPGAASGSGASQVQVAVATNVGPARTGAVTIGGHPVSIVQASGCTYSVSPTVHDVPGTGGSPSVTLMTAAGCTWSGGSGANWITLSPPSGAGPAQVSLAVAPNASPARNGTVTLAGQTLTVNQASQCTWILLPPFHQFDASGGNGNVLVIVSGGACTWTAESTADWIRMTAGMSGTGNGLVQFVAAPNPGAARSGVVMIAGQRYVVNQGGRP